MNKKNILIQKKIKGEHISPVLPNDIKNYLIDIDGTICDDIPNEEPDRMSTATVYPEALITLNKWYDQGHIITFFKSRIEIPRGGNYHWIDNHMVRATRYDGKFTELVEKNVKIQVFK